MKKLFILSFCLISTSYFIYVFTVFSKGIEQQILAATEVRLYPAIPRKIAQEYLKYSSQTNHILKSGQSTMSFSVAGCGSGADCESTIKVLKILSNNGANLESRNNGYTVLHEAILFGEEEIVKVLIDIGADINSQIHRQGSSVDKLNALQFAKVLEQKNKEKYKSVVNVLLSSI